MKPEKITAIGKMLDGEQCVDVLGFALSVACGVAHELGMSKLELQQHLVRLWDEGGKDPEIAAYKRAHQR